MWICYVDEAGDTGALPAVPDPLGNDQPVFVISGLMVAVNQLDTLTNEFLKVKRQFFPKLPYPSANHLDTIIPEIKGRDLRRNAMTGNRDQIRHSIGFLDHVLRLLERCDSRLMSRIWVKPLGGAFDGKAVYTSSMQTVCSWMDQFLSGIDDTGFCIADARNKPKNVNVSHSIFTKKFQASTAFYSRLIELPTFGHSDNHAPIQLCDIICSALLYPIACHVYCDGYVANVHVQPNAQRLKQRFADRLKHLQYRFQDGDGRFRGGITVSDPLEKRSARLMFS